MQFATPSASVSIMNILTESHVIKLYHTAGSGLYICFQN